MVRSTPTKRDLLIETAGRLFCAEGIHATGIDRILEEAGVAKMTLYKHFRSKDDLILATIRRKDEQWRDALFRRADQLATDPAGRVLALFTALDEWIAGDTFTGCLFTKATGEYPCADDPIHAAVHEHKRLVRRHVARLLQQAGADDTEQLARELCLLMDGAVAQAQSCADRDAAKVARRAATRLLQSAGLPVS